MAMERGLSWYNWTPLDGRIFSAAILSLSYNNFRQLMDNDHDDEPLFLNNIANCSFISSRFIRKFKLALTHPHQKIFPHLIDKFL